MAGFEHIGDLLEWYAALFYGCCFTWYANSLLTARSHWTWAACAAGSTLIRILLPRLMETDATQTAPTALRLLLILGVSMILAWLCFRRHGRLLVYVCVSWAAVFELTFFISYTVVFVGEPVYESISEALLDGTIPDEDAFLAAVLTVAYLLQAVMSGVLTLLCIFSCRTIIRSFPRERSELSGPEFRLLALPAVVGILMSVLLRMLIVTVADGVPTFLFDRFPPLKIVVPAIALVAGASIIYAVRTLRDMAQLEAERRRRLVVEEQLQSLRKLVADTERTNGHVRRVRHDLRNTLTVIQALSEDIPEGAALRAYLDDLNGDVQALERPFKTGDPVADTLLASKYQELRALDGQARFETEDLVLPDVGAISSYDLGIVLGNALDNALTALRNQKEGGRFIRLAAFRCDDLLFLTVENSTDGMPLRTPDGLPASTKTEDGHGLGLPNIRAIAEKYDGTMDWKAAGGVFTLSVMVRLPAESQSAPDRQS